jgi:peptide/nickel transport system substrate-binding protein
MNLTWKRTAIAVALTASFAAPATAQTKPVTIVVPEAIISLDPCNTSHSHVGRPMKQNVVETLVELDPANAGVLPRLAKSWELLEDGVTWRFVLRDDVKFHDGEGFTSAAVKAAVERTLNPQLTCITRDKFFGSTTLETTLVDDYTIDIKPTPPQTILPILMTALAISSPKTAPDAEERNPIGTGPFRIENWTQGESLALRRFDEYWGGPAAIESVNFVYREESSVAAAMVTTGEADLAPYISVQDATNPDTDVAYLNTETVNLVFTNNVAPLDDVRVRKAMNFAIDRNAFIGTILSKDTQVASQYVLPFINGYNIDIQPWPYDPEQARALLAEAKADGVPVDTELTFYGAAGFMSNQTDVMTALVQMWADVGVNVRIQAIDKAQLIDLLSRPHDGRSAGIIVRSHDNNTGDAGITLRQNYHSTGSYGEAEDPELDALIEQGEGASGEDRTKAFQAAFKRITDEIVPEAILFHLVGFARVGDRVEFTPNSLTNSELHLSEIKLKN